MERFGIPSYTGKSVKDASEYITKWRPDYINELLYRDDVAEYLQQLSLDNDGHEQF